MLIKRGTQLVVVAPPATFIAVARIPTVLLYYTCRDSPLHLSRLPRLPAVLVVLVGALVLVLAGLAGLAGGIVD